MADLVHRRRAAFPAASDFGVETPQAGAVQCQLAFELDGRAERVGVDLFEPRDEGALGGHVALLGRPAQVGQPAIMSVDAEGGRAGRRCRHDGVEA